LARRSTGQGISSRVALPLIADGKRIGNLSLYAGEPNAFNESTIDQYSDLANSLAYGVVALRTREEQKKTEEALRDSEQRLQDIIDNTTAVIFVKDLQLRYLLINREFERRHLISRDEIRGKTDFDLHPANVAEAVRANDRRVIEAAAPIQFEESVPSAQGPRYYLSSKFLLRDRTARPYAVCGIATDVTQLKRAEEAQSRRARQAALRVDVQLAFSDGIESALAAVLERIAKAIVRHLNAAAAQGIARKKAAERISQHASKLSQANEVLGRSLDALALDKQLQSFVDHVLVVLIEQLQGHSSTLWLIDVEQRAAHLHSVYEDGRVVLARDADHPNARQPRYWSTDDPEWVALQLNRPFLHHDPADDPELNYTVAQRARFSAFGIHALLLIPLVFGPQLVGVLSVRITGNRELDREDMEFAQSLAQQATLAIELARLAEQGKQIALANEREKAAQERAAELAKANEALRGCLDALASVPELDEFLGQVMAAMTQQFGAASSILRLRDFEQNVLTLDLVFQEGRVMTPAEAKYPPNLRSLPLDERQRNLLKGPAAVLHLLDPKTRIPEEFRSYLLSLGARTSLVIPLNLGGELVGSVTFRFKEDREFRPEELEIARALASQASLAIELTRLAKAARQSAVLEERSELAGEIHDSLAQIFTGIFMQLGAAKKVMQRGGTNSLDYVERAIELAQFGLAEAGRSAFSFQPSVIDELGLIRAMQKLADGSNIPGKLSCDFASVMIFSLLAGLSAASVLGLSVHSKSPNSVKSLVLVGRITNTSNRLVDGSGESFLLVRLHYGSGLMGASFVSRKEYR
jgi:PAS domain S-box-containing protein